MMEMMEMIEMMEMVEMMEASQGRRGQRTGCLVAWLPGRLLNVSLTMCKRIEACLPLILLFGELLR
jgi:hypothetical protein